MYTNSSFSAYRKLILPALVSMGMAGFSFAQMPPMPPMSKVALSPKDAASRSALAIVVPPQPQFVSLNWDYALPLPWGYITFEVWCKDNYPTNGWSLTTNVSAPPVRFPANLPMRFFIVRARDTRSGLSSEWGKTK